jgi:hypothetical protein
MLVSSVEAVLRSLDRFLIFVFGDPHWKSRTRIDWRKVLFFRKPLTAAERTALLRQGEQVLGHEYGDETEDKVKRELS